MHILPPEARNYTYQPIISGSTLNISLIAISVRGISGVARVMKTIEGTGL